MNPLAKFYARLRSAGQNELDFVSALFVVGLLLISMVWIIGTVCRHVN